ncbi:pectinesterase inhibitor 9-like protein [Tanacetum coccineum]|uniref:Pectinesterase inhibitor 9-like protein n=1 Tax=Tanacetum coccineum TaxID=301880 RepID=A0ABQ4XK54_9ASTR
MIFGFSGMVESRSAARVYLEAQCRTTLYRDLCVRTLLPYVEKDILGPQQLAQVSLVVCLSKARTTKAYVNMVAEHFNETRSTSGDNQAVEECLRQINNGVDQITLALKEFQKMKKDREENFVLHEGNVQSWVGAALTNADLCVDGLLGDGIGGKEKVTIKVKFMNVKQLASNSLAMFNRFTSRHRASHIVKNP